MMPAATLAAVLIGVAYAVAPLPMVMLTLIALVCVAAVRRCEPGERSAVARILAIGVGLRVAAIAALFAAAPLRQAQFLSLFPDAHYMTARSVWTRNVWLGVPIGPHQWNEAFTLYGASSYLSGIAWLQALVGVSPAGVSLFSVLMFVTAVLLLHREVRRGYGHTSALVALTVLLLWPTLFAWSISALKESTQLFATTVTVVAALHLVRAGTWPTRAASVGALVAALFALGSLRAGSLALAAAGLAVGVLYRAATARRAIALALIVVALAGAWRVRERAADQVRAAASRHYGHVMSAGTSYRVLDQRFYSGGDAAIRKMTLGECVVYLVKSAAAFIIVPLPSHLGSRAALPFIGQQLAWYALTLAALVAAAAGLRRDPWLTAMLVGAALGGLMIIAPNSGNVGTLIRHRDMVTPFVVCLGALGLVFIAETLRAAPRLGARG